MSDKGQRIDWIDDGNPTRPWKDLGGEHYAPVVCATPDTSAEFAVKSAAGATVTVTVASSNSLSAAGSLGNKRAGSILLPADVGTATVLTFQASYDGSTYGDVYDQYGSEYKVTIPAVSKMVLLDPFVFATFPYLKVRFGTAASANTYGSARDLIIGLRA